MRRRSTLTLHFPFKPATPDSPVRWSLCQGLDGQSTLIPASCVSVPYFFEAGVEPFSHMPISTGLAAGRSVPDCIEKGMCEISERDALMIVWMNCRPSPRIPPASCIGISDELDGLLAAGMMPGTRWFLNLLTLDIDVPIVTAALINDSGLPLTSFGIAADMDPATALRGALEEALLTRLLVNRSDLTAERDEASGGDLRTLRDHLLAHAASPQLRESMRFLTDYGPEIDFSVIAANANSKDTASQRCIDAGLRPIWVNLTTSDVGDLGFKVVRTVIPGAQPLDNDHNHRYVGGSRLTSVPAALGWSSALATFNPAPHPFP